MTGSKYQVSILDIQRFTDKGNLRAFVDVQVGKSLKIMGCRVVQQPNQKAWVSMPQRSWTDKDGQTKYAPMVELSGELKEEVDAAVLLEWAKA